MMLTTDNLDDLRPDLVTNVRDKHGCAMHFNGSEWIVRNADGYVFSGQSWNREIGPFTYEVPESATEAAPDAALMDRIVQAEKEDIRTQVARLTEQLAKLTGKVASANDDVDDRLTTLESSVSVLEDKIPGAVAKDGFDETPEYAEFSGMLSDVPVGVAQATGRFSDKTYWRDDLGLWHRPLDIDVQPSQVIPSAYQGGIQVSWIAPAEDPTSFVLSEVPEGINTVWDAADGQEIHRLANGGWIFGEDPEGEFGTAGELVYTPEDYTVYLFEPKDSEA